MLISDVREKGKKHHIENSNRVGMSTAREGGMAMDVFLDHGSPEDLGSKVVKRESHFPPPPPLEPTGICLH